MVLHSGLTTGTTVNITLDDSDADTTADLTKTDTTNASGRWSVSLTTAEVQALEEGDVVITVSGTDVGGNTGTATKTISYDVTAPTITTSIGGTNDSRTVSATDNEAGTSMRYKIIASGISCDTSTMASGTTAYTEGNTIVVASTDNGKKVCFSSTDAAGNKGYATTSVLTAVANLTMTVGAVPAGSAQSKDISISAVSAGATVTYNLITDSSCNATNYGSGGTTVALSSNAGTVTVTNESDINKYLCFKITKTNFVTQYFGSEQITGIDTTAPAAPTALVGPGLFGNDTTPSFTVTVGERGGTVTLYSDNACATAVSGEVSVTDTSVPYQVSVTANALSGDGARSFYAAHTDVAINTSDCSSASASYTLDTALPSITTTVGGTSVSREVSASDDDSSMTTMRYAIIDGSAICGAGEMGIRSLVYTEGEVITIADAQDNGRKACFSSTDAAGNVGYAATAVLTVTKPVQPPSQPSRKKSKRDTGAALADDFIHIHTPNEEATVEHSIHRHGDSHPEIRQIQSHLNRTPCKVADDGHGSVGNETEYFGPRTRDAVFCFQSEVGLNQTGVFDPPTRHALFGIPDDQRDTPAARTVREREADLRTRLVDLLTQLHTKLKEAVSDEE